MKIKKIIIKLKKNDQKLFENLEIIFVDKIDEIIEHALIF